MPRPPVDMMGNYLGMDGPPPQHTVKNIDEFLEELSRGVFEAGISWRVVDPKWPTIKKAFHGFKVERIARMTDREIDALAKDERGIRSRPKIAAIVHNAGEILALERTEGFTAHLRSFDEYEDLAKDLKKRRCAVKPSVRSSARISPALWTDRKSTRLNSSHQIISYA